MDRRDMLKNSQHLKYLKSLKPEALAKRYFIANDNAKWTDDIGTAKNLKDKNGNLRFPYAISFLGESGSFLNGLIVHQLIKLTPKHLKVNAVAVAEDIDKLLRENENFAVEIFTDLDNAHDYAVEFSIELLKIYGNGLSFIRSQSNNLGL